MKPVVDLVCFDVDGTLLAHPQDKVVWQILNRRFTGSDHVNRTRLTDYLEGRITYDRWVELDVSDWISAGATRSQMVEALAELVLVTGAAETLRALKDAGCRLAAISGTIDLCLEQFFPEEPFDDVYANRILFDADGVLNGWKATPFDMDGKARALDAILEREGIPRERSAFVGDNLNDLAVARAAGLSIAFNPKHRLLEAAVDVVVRGADLRAVLPHLMRIDLPAQD